MRASLRLLSLLLLTASLCAQAKPTCVSIERARDFIGQKACVRGRVFHVRFTKGGTALLQFCEEHDCPFSVVVFNRDLEKVGNIQMFEGKTLEVSGTVKDYRGTPEIVVKKRSQFSGDALRP